MAGQSKNPRTRQHTDAATLHDVEHTETVHHEKKKRPTESGVRELNITSMLDVTFQLLIFFILTANFAVDEGVLAADMPQGIPPEPTEVQPPPDEPIIIVLRAVGDECGIFIQRGRTIPPGDFGLLYDQLNGWRYDPQQNPNGTFEADNPIIIKPAGKVEWGHVVSAFNAVIRARYTNVSFAQAG